MANVIEIVIHATDAATAQIRGVTGAATQMQASLGALQASVVGAAGIAAAFTVAGVAAVGLANRLSDEIEMLQNLSARTGATVNDLRILRQVMVEAGQSPDALTNALTILNRNLANGSKELVALVGNTKNPMEALLKLSQIVARGGNAAQVSFAAMGRGGGELAPILADLAERFGDVESRLGRLDEATIRAAGAWDKLMDRMGTATKRFLDGVGAQLLKFLDFMASSTGMVGMIARAMGFGVPEAPATGGGAPLAGPPGRRGSVELGDVDPSESRRQAEEAMRRFRNANAEISTLVESTAMGIESAIGTVFSNLIGGMQTFGSAIKTLFEGIAQSVLAALAKIATSRLLIWIGGLLGGGFGGILGELGGALVGRSGGFASGNAMGAERGNTYVIQTLEPGTLVRAMQPGGSWNRASDVVRIGSRY